MKKKQFFSILLALTFTLMTFSGCQMAESGQSILKAEEGQMPAETESAKQQKDINVRIYPIDIQFTECAELVLPAEPQIPEPTEGSIVPPEETEPQAVPDMPETTQATEPTEMITTDPVHLQNVEDASIGGPPITEESADSPTIMAFRGEDETDFAEGKAIYHIQIQYQDGEAILVLTGTLWPGEKLQWDEAEQKAEDANGEASDEMETSKGASTYTEAFLKMKLEEVLLGDVTWISCAEANTYAHNQKLTKSMVSGQTVFYTNDAHTVLQIQSYDAAGMLNCVVERSENGAMALVNGTAGEIQWDEEQYPVMHLVVEDTVVQANPEYQNQLVQSHELIQSLQQQNAKGKTLIIVLVAATVLLVVANLICLRRILHDKKQKVRKAPARRNPEQSQESAGQVKSIGTVHNIGGRSGQQDNFDVVNCAAGTLAIVADGMGGLTDGDKVSQKIVATMRSDSARIRLGQTDHVLCQMLAHANQEVNRMLGPARQYKCGSTLLAVLVEKNTMQWITVGDSRIYLYRSGALIQVNREHVYSKELLEKAINGKLSFADALRDPQADRLSSFVGMGELKHVDICLNRLKLCAGDKILLMSDGVFNTLSNEEIAHVIDASTDASTAAARLEQKVLQKNAPNQDNFTCVILEV